MMDELLASDAVGVNRIGMITIAGRFYARRGRSETARRSLQEGRDLVEPLHRGPVHGPIYVGLVELSLVERQARGRRRRSRRSGVGQLARTKDRYYVGALLAIGARAEADVAEAARARREPAEADARPRPRGRVREARSARSPPGRRRAAGASAAASGPYAAAARRRPKRATGTVDPAAWEAAERAAAAAG